MSEDIIGTLKELSDTIEEIKRLSVILKKHRTKKKDLEETIITYLIEEDKPGIRYENITILSEKKKTRGRIKQKTKEANIIFALESLGVKDPTSAARDILDSMKGQEQTVPKLTIINE